MTTETTTETTATETAKPGVARERFDEALKNLPPGLVLETKAAWDKITGPSGNRIYVSRAKRVKEVHLSGFGADAPYGVPPKAPNGKVQAWLDTSGSEDETMARFASALADLASQPAPAPEPETQEAAPTEAKPQKKRAAAPEAPAPEALADMPRDEDRVKRIKRRAKELGVGE